MSASIINHHLCQLTAEERKLLVLQVYFKFLLNTIMNVFSHQELCSDCGSQSVSRLDLPGGLTALMLILDTFLHISVFVVGFFSSTSLFSAPSSMPDLHHGLDKCLMNE